MRRRGIVITKKQALMVIVCVLAYDLVVIAIESMAKTMYPVLSIPIGLLGGAVTLGTLWIPVSFVGMEMAIEARGIKQKLIGTILLLMLMIPLLLAVERGINSVKDIKVGPQEIIVYDAETERRSGGYRGGTSYYFIAKVQEDDIKTIRMLKEQQYDFCGELIETAEWKHGNEVRYRVRYFENTNILDDVEVYE